MAPTGQGGQWQEVLCCSICNRHFNETYLPVSLICGHVICRRCAEKPENQERPCAHDDWKPTRPPAEYPTNVALLSVIYPRKQCMSHSRAGTETEKKIDQLAIQIAKLFREADSERGGTVSSRDISRTLQRKVLALLCYQWCEPDGRQKYLKMCRGIAERVLIEIILSIQSNTHVSSQLWSAVRARGCQFLGPAMQDDVLRLILMTLETGECIARKNLVMYVVQTLGADYPQVSKTCVGHVVQLLYRASCFNVLKRDGESSLMQLKEEFRTYEALRREHDSQIVQIAFESGLRIGPDQWSALLYADQSHRSHMQSIIDKLQSRNSYLQGIEELRALSSSPTSMLVPAYRYFLSQVIPCLEHFAASQQGAEQEDSVQAVADSLSQIRTLLRLHCSTQDDLRRMSKEDRRQLVSSSATTSDTTDSHPPPPPPKPPQKRYQMGIPPQRMSQQYFPPPNFYPPNHHQRQRRRGPPPVLFGFPGRSAPVVPQIPDPNGQRLVIMQSPGPVVMIPPPSAVTPVPWTAASPTGSVIYPAASPPGGHTVWIQSTDPNLMPVFDYGMVWGPTTMLRESGADAEQLLAKRNEILKRLHPSEDDEEPEGDGGVGHVSYTVASSVLDDSYRMDHHPIAMIPVPTIDLPTIPIEMLEITGRPRAASLTSQSPAPTVPEGTVVVAPTVVPEGTVVVAAAEPASFNPAVPPPPAPQPMLVDQTTGLLTPMTPMRPILVAHPQNVVSNSLDKIVDVKERLSEAQGCASEAENAHLRMELRMAESEMAHLDPFTKNNCLLRELQQVDRELQQLQIEPIRQ